MINGAFIQISLNCFFLFPAPLKNNTGIMMRRINQSYSNAMFVLKRNCSPILLLLIVFLLMHTLRTSLTHCFANAGILFKKKLSSNFEYHRIYPCALIHKTHTYLSPMLSNPSPYNKKLDLLKMVNTSRSFNSNENGRESTKSIETYFHIRKFTYVRETRSIKPGSFAGLIINWIKIFVQAFFSSTVYSFCLTCSGCGPFLL